MGTEFLVAKKKKGYIVRYISYKCLCDKLYAPQKVEFIECGSLEQVNEYNPGVEIRWQSEEQFKEMYETLLKGNEIDVNWKD